MTLRTLRFGLWTFASTCVVASGLLVGLAAAVPLDLADSHDPTVARTKPQGNAQPRAVDGANGVWDTDLRRPFHDDPPPPPPAPTQTQTAFVQPPPQLTLLGTVVEPGHSYALFAAGGKSQFKSVGDDVSGAKLIAIRETGCTLLWNGREIATSVQRSSASPTADSPMRARRSEDR